MSRILIAEDEVRISRFIEKGLRAAAYSASIVADGITALDYATTGQFDLMLLDVGLPRLDGFTVLNLLRKSGSQLPVIVLTARTSVTDTVAGLNGGANDYMAKPFRFEELLARIKVRLRETTTEDTSRLLRYGSLELDLLTRLARVGDVEVELSAREFAMTRLFLRNPGQVLTRDQLLSRVWGYDYIGTSNVVDVYLHYLRQKLGGSRFVTIRGAGYRLLEI